MQPESDGSPQVSAWRSGEWLLLPPQRRLLRAGEPVAVDQRAFDLIELLVLNHDRILSQREITTSLWGQRPVSDNTLRQVLYKARRALGDDGEHQNLIRTLPGRGLQWVAPVEAASVPAAPHAKVASPGNRHRYALIWAGALALVLLAGFGLWSRNAQAPADGPIAKIAIEPIENASGDEALDWVSNGLPGLLASLLGQSGGIDVIDPQQVSHVWSYTPQDGRTRAQNLRFVTGADVLVGGRLRKLADHLYELTLQVARGDATPAVLTLAGESPGVLAVDSVKRIRRVLDMEPRAAPVHLPHDAFVAEAYARGVDLATHGQWTDALTNFKLCVQNAPDFLPAVIKLGQAQYLSDQMSAGKQSLQTALKLAVQNKDDDSAAHALMELGSLESRQQRESAALQLMQQATVYASRSGNFSLQAENILNMVEANSALLDLKVAHAHLAQASKLISDHHLRGLRTALLAARRELANKEGDKAGEQAASRALLAENDANGNQHGALGSLLSMARVKLERAEFAGAASILQYAYTRARDYHDAFLTVAAGDYLASTLLDLGVDARVDQIADNMVSIATRQDNAAWLGLAVVLHGGASQYRGDSKAALGYYQKAYALLDPKQQPVNAAGTLFFVAVTAYQSDPALLPQLSKAMHAIAGAQADPKPYRTRQLLVEALRQSAAHKVGEALELLQQAADGESGEALDSDVRMVAFAIGQHDKAAAEVALKGFDAASWKAATDLRFYSRWAASQGDQHDHDVAERRIAALRRSALHALDESVVKMAISG